MFPKGARLSFVRVPHPISRDPGKPSYHKQGRPMKTKPVFWPIRFVITTVNPQGEDLVTWTLDQRVRDKYNEGAWDRLYNQVQEHLNSLSERTGCQYRIDTWGYRETVDDYLFIYQIKVH